MHASEQLTNLIFMFTDEQKASTMSAYGNHRIETPNLDRLASQSCVFENAYVTQPVCTPSRSSILTGLYPHTNGCIANNIPLPQESKCFPEMLPQGKYATGYDGKWHLGDEIFAQHGFDEWKSIEDLYRRYYRPYRDRDSRSTYHRFLIDSGFKPRDGDLFGRGECARLPEDYTKAAYVAKEACDFIETHRREEFVLFVNFLEPHMPFYGPRDDQYNPSEIDLPPNFDSPPTIDQPLKTRIFRDAYRQFGHGGFPLRTESDWRKVISNYWGLCSLVDTQVGRIMRTIGNTGLDDDTIVVFTSDHGDMMGSHRLLTKCVMFEEAAKIPMMIRLPGQKESMTIGEPTSQIDLVPTLLDLMDEKIPSHLQGRSLAPRLAEGEGREHRNIFFEWNGRETGDTWRERVVGQESVKLPGGYDEKKAMAAVSDDIRTVITPDGWKLNCSVLGEHELYNLRADPFERINMAKDREKRQVMNELLEAIKIWQGETDDRVGLPEVIT